MATTSDSADSPFPNLGITSQWKAIHRIHAYPNWVLTHGPNGDVHQGITYTLKFEAAETGYLVIKGQSEGTCILKEAPHRSYEFVEFGAGDIVTIPKGLGCTWDVSTAIDKHYKSTSSSPLHPRSQSSSSINIDLS